jgi:hypothetical protein
MNLITMIEVISCWAMVDVDINPVPPKVIGRKACLWARSALGLSKDLGAKRHPNIRKWEESKETREFMKVGEGGVQCNK